MRPRAELEHNRRQPQALDRVAGCLTLSGELLEG
jgi:hypothetical protein